MGRLCYSVHQSPKSVLVATATGDVGVYNVLAIPPQNSLGSWSTSLPSSPSFSFPWAGSLYFSSSRIFCSILFFAWLVPSLSTFFKFLSRGNELRCIPFNTLRYGSGLTMSTQCSPESNNSELLKEACLERCLLPPRLSSK